MTTYINHKLYTDVKSYRLYDIRCDRAMAQEVKRDFKPEFVPGGFSAICINDHEQRKAPVVDADTEPFEVVKIKGVWCRKEELIYCHFPKSCFNTEQDWNEFISKNNVVIRTMNGEDTAFIVKLTKTGKIAFRYEKLGVESNECLAFYDNNF